MAAVVVIPARLSSVRFPGKVLAFDTGKPLIQHVVDQVRQCKRVGQVIVAIDDQKIAKALAPFGTQCVLTDPKHPSGTDRVAEVAAKLGAEASVIINVQGDEPEIDPETIDHLDWLMSEEQWQMATAAFPFESEADAADPNRVKVVVSESGRAMYFSRSAIPYYRDANQGLRRSYYLHVGIYAYRRDTLLQLAKWAPTRCELAEKLEQLRALEHDVSIGVAIVKRASHGIDTPEQYEAFIQRQKAMRN